MIILHLTLIKIVLFQFKTFSLQRILPLSMPAEIKCSLKLTLKIGDSFHLPCVFSEYQSALSLLK